MARYFIALSFKGTRYHGWQSQPNAVTVQAELERALQTITGESVKTTGAGRTDTGVHAHRYVAHFDTLSPLPENTRDFIYKMNAVLPGDIAIVNVCAVMPDDHARYSAISRTYQYTICRVKDPFTPELSWYYSLPLDMEAMNQAALLLKGYTDFTSFSKLHSDVKNNHCGILDATWSEEGTFMIFTIRANRFLRNMVRSIVGTMTDIGRGKLDMPGFKAVIEGKNRNLAGFSVPPQGLSLFEITYPAHIKL